MQPCDKMPKLSDALFPLFPFFMVSSSCEIIGTSGQSVTEFEMRKYFSPEVKVEDLYFTFISFQIAIFFLLKVETYSEQCNRLTSGASILWSNEGAS